MLTGCADDLPNPHRSCIRQLLRSLVCHEYDYKRYNLQLRDLQRDLKRELDKSVFECSHRRKLQCESKERLEEFEREIGNIDETTEYFKERIEDMKKKIADKLKVAANCYQKLQLEKRNMIKFHEKTINHLKSVIVCTDDEKVKANCRQDIDQLSVKYIDEMNFLRKCEITLQAFLKFLQDCHTQKNPTHYFQEYQWIPPGKDTEIVDTVAGELKKTMGPTLIKMFAKAHVYQASNPNTFMATYVKNLEQNEQLVKAKLQLIELRRQ